MVTLHAMLKGEVNVYTMNFRGTGRSTRFDCKAPQAITNGSPFGEVLDMSEVGPCANALENEYGDLASFSITIAATDIATFISEHSNGASTIVYGVSYGTALLERLIHLAHPEVTGYVLDSIATASGSKGVVYASRWDIDFGEVGDAFMELCSDNNECSARFKSAGLRNTLQSVIDLFDSNPNSTCAALVTEVSKNLSTDPPSFILRCTLGTLLQESFLRKLIPPLVYRMHRCETDDVDVLTFFFSKLYSAPAMTTQDKVYESTLLLSLINYSEFWEPPSPSFSELRQRFTSAKISDSGAHDALWQCCAFTKDESEACQEVGVGNYSGNGIVFKRDRYWNKRATIPEQASILLMQGTLDPQTAPKNAKYQLQALIGDNKELISFEHATHGILVSTLLDDPVGGTCGMEILASYVTNGGDLSRLDKSCLNEMVPFNLTVPEAYVQDYLGTDDAYDGTYYAPQGSTDPSSDTGPDISSEEIHYQARHVFYQVATTSWPQLAQGHAGLQPAQGCIAIGLLSKLTFELDQHNN